MLIIRTIGASEHCVSNSRVWFIILCCWWSHLMDNRGFLEAPWSLLFNGTYMNIKTRISPHNLSNRITFHSSIQINKIVCIHLLFSGHQNEQNNFRVLSEHVRCSFTNHLTVNTNRFALNRWHSVTCGPFYQHVLTLIPGLISVDEINYSQPPTVQPLEFGNG